jgi:LPXTG-motif cell wall-anchored protein
MAYPGGSDDFGILTLSHFSPYFIYDKLTDEENSALKTSPKTGDDVTYLTISGLGLIMTLALGLMFKTNFGKRKFDE